MHGLRTLDDAKLHTLRNKALYRGLDATARAIKREQVRRLEGQPTLHQAA